jgi:hypothetical protein
MTDENNKAENRLVTFMDSEFSGSIQRSGTYESDNNDLFDRYNCELYGDEEEGLSKIVSSDVADGVDSDLSALARVFLGNAPPVEFLPVNGSQEAIAEARDVNAFVQWVLCTSKNSYKVQIDWLKEILLQKTGYIEYGIKKVKRSRTRKFEGLSEIDIARQKEMLEKEKNVKSVKIEREIDETLGGEFDQVFSIKATILEEKQEYFIQNVPWEDMRISRGVQTKDEANVFGKVFRKRRGDLIADGIPIEEVRKLPVYGSGDGEAKSDRFRNQGGDELGSSFEWQNEEVEGQDAYVLFDMEGKGNLQRRHVIKFGSIVVENEPFDHVPYAGTSAIQMPHNIIGKSRGELSVKQQRINSVLTRNMMDNISDVNMGRYIVDDQQVNMDDLLDIRTRGIVRSKNPLQSVVPEPVLYNSDKTLQVIQYMDSKHSQSTGQMQSNQALTSDQLNQETATRFDGVKEASLSKIELVARNIAELAYKDLYEGLAWFGRHFQDSDMEAYLFGREMTFSPSSWKFDHRLIAKVGTGAGDDDKTIQALTAILGSQQAEIDIGSGLADSAKKYNVYRELVRASDLHGVENYYNDPSRPDQVVMAENEQLKKQIQQLGLAVQQSQDQLSKAETIRAEASLLIAQSRREEASQKDQIKVAEMRQEMQQFLLTLKQKGEQFDQTIIKDLTELELKYGKDVPGAIV